MARKRSRNNPDWVLKKEMKIMKKENGLRDTNIYNSVFELTKQLPGCFEGNFK